MSFNNSLQDNKFTDAQFTNDVVTHNGVFHADEVVACGILANLMGIDPEKIERDRNANLEGKTVVDMGGEFNPAQGRFDHHQREFYQFWRTDDGVHLCKMASAGVIWEIAGRAFIRAQGVTDSETVAKIHDSLREFMFAVDAIDVGAATLVMGKGTVSFQETFSSLISGFNAFNAFAPEQHANFVKAVNFATEVLKSKVKFYEAKIQYDNAIRDSVLTAKGDILEVTAGPWVSFICENWEETEHFKVAVYQSGPDFRVQALPQSKEDRQSMRVPAPKNWRGLRGEDLVKASGVNGATFVHAAGFIGGAASYEAALEMAKKWIAEAEA